MIEAKLKSLRDVKPHDYVIRFLFGGLCTLLAGLIAKHSGPEIGGLFLAFPAIFRLAPAFLRDMRETRSKKPDSTERSVAVWLRESMPSVHQRDAWD